jgi:cytosine/adenosine deaminase-related metal-dependent hydrolase
LIRYQAAWVVPIARPPIAGGAVAVEDGRIAAVEERPSGPVVDLGSAAILPGLVNAHVHLELSWMRGRVPPCGSMCVWAQGVMALRRTMTDEPREPIAPAIASARASGTCLVGDITNTLNACDALARSELSAMIFRELLGFSAPDPDAVVLASLAQLAGLRPTARLRTSLAPHAPYSVSPALLEAIAERTVGRPVSIHLGESPEEIQFLRDGAGEWRGVLERLGAWNPSWTPPGCGPVEYIARHGLLSDRLLAVHGVQFTGDDLARLAAARATVVTCPRSNRWTGAGVPPVEGFYASGVRVAIGTDSLASVDDLNMFHEMAEVRRLAPSVPASAILRSATQSGAEALGFGEDLGTIEAGKRAELIAVRVPDGTADVEQYLLRGIEPAAVCWLAPA